MKKLLHFILLISFMQLYSTSHIEAQSILFSEDFTGFNTGSHTSPSTSDASSNLDARTSVPGWTGTLVYPAGGEIKVGTGTSTGWIETPAINLSGAGGNFIIRFDLARWTGDNSTVQVYFNNEERGSVLTPSDNFQTYEIQCLNEVTSGKIRIKGLTKRFYLDNLSVITAGIPASVSVEGQPSSRLRIYPVPALNSITVDNSFGYDELRISDIYGRIRISVNASGMTVINVNLSELKNGIYILSGRKGAISENLRFVKSGD